MLYELVVVSQQNGCVQYCTRNKEVGSEGRSSIYILCGSECNTYYWLQQTEGSFTSRTVNLGFPYVTSYFESSYKAQPIESYASLKELTISFPYFSCTTMPHKLLFWISSCHAFSLIKRFTNSSTYVLWIGLKIQVLKEHDVIVKTNVTHWKEHIRCWAWET